jgi:hypothetical protein
VRWREHPAYLPGHNLEPAAGRRYSQLVTGGGIAGVSYSCVANATRAVRESAPPPPRAPRLFDRVRDTARVRHYSRRTEKAYLAWIRRFILFHGKRHPFEMGTPEITQFLSSLAVEGNVAASTQNQALSGLLFLYRDVLEQDLP